MADKIFTTTAKNLKQLKVACIMDEFTLHSYMPECILLELTPDNFQAEIDLFKPDMLFIESAWRGRDSLWDKKITQMAPELIALAEYCKSKSIPIVFWCKEDPVHFDAFINAAALADFVFTTDIDCVPWYKSKLGHERVFHLHFGAQPKSQNPIEYFPRQDKFCFAGTYYHKYKSRAAIFNSFAPIFIRSRGFDIYDRNHGKDIPGFMFPEIYERYILGSLPFEEIDKAYKGYYYGVNMNSICQSQSMFARRVFELILSNTIVVSNFSQGVANYFGDLTICTDSANTMTKTLDALWANEAYLRKFRLLGLRNVLESHLYADRLDYIAQKVYGRPLLPGLPMVAVLVTGNKATESFMRQRYANKILYIVDQDKKQKNSILAGTAISSIQADYIAFFDEDDYYGENYLTDLMLATRYTQLEGIGKSGYYTYTRQPELIGDEYRYCVVTALTLRRAVFKKSFWGNTPAGSISGSQTVRGKFIAIDEFNYCENYSGSSLVAVDDITLPNTGITPAKWDEISQEIKPSKADKKPLHVIRPDDALPLFTPTKAKKGVTALKQGSSLIINTNLTGSDSDYIYLGKFFDIKKFGENFAITMYGTSSLGMRMIVLFYDKNKKKLYYIGQTAHSPIEVNAAETRSKGAVYFRVALRLTGINKQEFKEIIIAEPRQTALKDMYVPRSETLVLTSRYPPNSDTGTPVHEKVAAYKNAGYVYDVIHACDNVKQAYAEYDGISITQGSDALVKLVLQNGYFTTVCVHYLTHSLWNIIKPYANKTRLLVWIYGPEIISDEDTTSLWNEVFGTAKALGIRFIFATKALASEVKEAYGQNLDEKQIAIIHDGYGPEGRERELRLI
ncbi:MAG: glycosyltransferase [Defluviitaleaceae bacterium]|nr:glycosyltransferase [Defluviitaleaceae bacterium]